MRFNVIHVYGLGTDIIKVFESAFPGREIQTINGEAELVASIGDMEVIFAFRPPRGIWSGAKRLRLIQTIGAGVDSVLPASDLSSTVRITNARGVHGVQMSEYALAMMLAFAKELPLAIANQRERYWQRTTPSSLEGKTCSILGMGTIGRVVAERAKQFGMRVIGTQREPKGFIHADEVVGPEQTEYALREADYVVVTLPLTPLTRNLLNETRISHMKREAVLINMARGGIIEEPALAKMLIKGRLRGAVLDALAEEPLPKSSELWTTPNLIITPHMAGGIPGYLDRVLAIFIDNVRRFEEGRPLVNEVDRTRGY
jgi:D-2-hydroxyacid dehydrogenase (NADP+)